MSTTKKLTATALCIALSAVLPLLFHALGLGMAFSPLHLPALLCGIICGPIYGLACGVLGPIASMLATGMPTAERLLYFIPELMAYGFFAGLFFKVIRTKSRYVDMYIALVLAMLIGRVIGGAAQAIVLLSSAKEYSIAMWISGYFIGTWPGAILHLVVISAIVFALEKTKLIKI